MGAIHRFEQRLEHMVTGAFARAFRSAVQPMEIAAALQREVDNSAQILSRNRRLAPNNFTIDLSATDYDRLSTYGATLSSELASMLHEHAEEQHYMFAGPVQLHFQRDEELTTGRFRVRSQASAQVTPAGGQSVTDTAVRRASLTLEINGVKHPLEEPGVVIGRGSNADLRIDDPGVSRRHVEFRVQPGTDKAVVSVVDLGSTNGTTVNGQRVQHAILADGAVVQIGSTQIVMREAGPPARGPQQGAAPPPYAPQPDGPPHQPPSGGPAGYQPSTYQPAPYDPPPGSPPGPHGHQTGPPPSPFPQPKRSRLEKKRKRPPFRVADQPPPGSQGPQPGPWGG